jgi:sugar phosphate isomerase/epimerase
METVTRRGFLGTTVGAVGATAAGGVAAAGALAGMATVAAAEDASAPEQKPLGMHVGMLTAPFGGETLDKIADFAKSAGIKSLEVSVDQGSTQLDPTTFDAAKADAVKAMLSERAVNISALSYYDNMNEPDKTAERQAIAIKTIDAAAMLGVPVVCLIAGMAAPNMNKTNTIKKVLPKVFAPILAHAAEKQIKIALENYFETCLQGVDTFELLFDTIKDENFGLNYDPSHLYHQQCNYLLPVTMFANRIFHTHAKDCLVDIAQRTKMGVYARGWWRYVVPGYGNINWGEYISHLRMNGYKGVLSIEHEDSAFEREEGFIVGARHLNQFC